MIDESGRNMNKSQKDWLPCNSPLKASKVVRELEHTVQEESPTELCFLKKRPTKTKPRRNIMVVFPVESTKMETDSSPGCTVVEQEATGVSCNTENSI